MSNWRQVSFFERDDLSLDLGSISAVGSGRNCLVLGDSSGSISILNSSLGVNLKMVAFPSRVTHLKVVRKKPLLFALGEDESKTPILKLWNLDKLDKQGQPSLLRSSKITHGSKVFPVTAFAVLDDLTQLAIGLENGIVLLMRGDFSQSRFTNPKLIHEGSETVTGLGFHSNEGRVGLYIVTLARILLYGTLVSEFVKDQNVLDDIGTSIGNALVTPQESGQEMALGTPEAVYFYGPEGRGPCFLAEGEKTLLAWFKGYLLTVSHEKPFSSTSTATPTNAMASLELISPEKTEAETPTIMGANSSNGTILTIYDLKSKYIAYRGSFGSRKFDPKVGTAVGEPIRHIVSEWGQIYILTKSNKLFRLRENDLETKLASLFSKSMYTLAISIVTMPPLAIHGVKSRSESDEPEAMDSNTQWLVMDIYKRFGDYWYLKGEFDNAMKQFIKTIGHLEPSHVIRKFLEPQRIHNLTAYLEALHVKGLAGPNHTTLLLNCYTKLKDGTKLDAFIESDAVFDVETALRICRQSGYFSSALKLALKHDQHDLYMKIQIEDLKDFDVAVQYVSALDPARLIKDLKVYGFVLVSQRPEAMTDVLVRLCCFYHLRGKRSNGSSRVTSPESVDPFSLDSLVFPEDLIQYYTHQPIWCVAFLENVLEKRDLIRTSEDHQIEALMDPRILERESTSKQILSETLLELCLKQYANVSLAHSKSLSTGKSIEKITPMKREWHDKIMNVIETSTYYDSDHALVLCQSFEFADGWVSLCHKFDLYHELLDYYIRESIPDMVFTTCLEYGNQEDRLWTKALRYFTERPENKLSKEQWTQLLSSCKKYAAVPLLTVGKTRDYLLKLFLDLNEKRTRSQEAIQVLSGELADLNAKLESLKGSMVFQKQRCDLCQQPLELPSVYFHCVHSFHHR